MVVEPLGIDGTVTYNGLFLEHTWPEIREFFNFDLVSGDVEGSLEYAAALDDGGLSARIEDFQCRINDVALEMRDDGMRVLEVPSATVTGGKVLWPEAVIGAAEVKVEGPTARTWIEPDGTLGVMELMPKTAEEQVLEKARDVESKMHWTLDVKRFELAGASAEVEDRTLDIPQLVTVSDAALVLTDILTEQGARWGLEASALIAGSGRGTAGGEVSAMPAFADLEVGIEGLELGDLGGHIEQLAPIDLREGTVRSAGRLRFAPDERGIGPHLRGQLRHRPHRSRGNRGRFAAPRVGVGGSRTASGPPSRRLRCGSPRSTSTAPASTSWSRPKARSTCWS